MLERRERAQVHHVVDLHVGQLGDRRGRCRPVPGRRPRRSPHAASSAATPTEAAPSSNRRRRLDRRSRMRARSPRVRALQPTPRRGSSGSASDVEHRVEVVAVAGDVGEHRAVARLDDERSRRSRRCRRSRRARPSRSLCVATAVDSEVVAGRGDRRRVAAFEPAERARRTGRRRVCCGGIDPEDARRAGWRTPRGCRAACGTRRRVRCSASPPSSAAW